MSFGSSDQPLATSFFGSRTSSGPLTTSVSGGFSSAREIATTEGSLAATRDIDGAMSIQLLQPRNRKQRLVLLLLQEKLLLLPEKRASCRSQFITAVVPILLTAAADASSWCSSDRQKIRRCIEWRSFVFTSSMDGGEFRNYFRVTRTAFATLLIKLGPAIEKKTTYFGKPLSVEVRLAVFLYFAGHGCSLNMLRSQLGIGKSTASGILREVSKGIVGLMKSYISFPTQRVELLKLSMEFEDGYGIPGCVGALDGCQIPIVQLSAPKSEKFYNRKGFDSLNMSAVVDRSRRFLDVDVRWPGSVGDNRVFSNSAVGRLHG
ncbi:hypothetical protein PF010_g820 [Phytophthora fragariae]|uniref:Putative nuclease HARBI1 n=1 Tax=Phytophthora fragariae TaxID=53985 RepID=A0A6G0M1V6_9STRA|nr:hypothetical protein PF010_g820 [Phytophthora fragariae]